MTDPLDEIAKVGESTEMDDWPTDPRRAIRYELEILWTDLAYQRRQALNGVWSISCESVVSRIMGLTRIVGPTPAMAVPCDLVVDGWWQKLHRAIDVEASISDEDMAAVREVYESHYTHRAQ